MSSEHDQTDLGFAVIDDGRAERTGMPEVVFGQGKTPQQIGSIVEHLNERGHPALVTRLDAAAAQAVRTILSGCTYEPVPRLLWRCPQGLEPFKTTVQGRVIVLSGGTSDFAVAEEAARCAEWFGMHTTRRFDVGVAGLHRLLSRMQEVREADVIIAVAGMEGALVTVVAGLVTTPVIAVPTSVGYGANLEGVTALLAMLTSCSGGIGVVNIDNGFGAAQLAYRILAGRR